MDTNAQTTNAGTYSQVAPLIPTAQMPNTAQMAPAQAYSVPAEKSQTTHAQIMSAAGKRIAPQVTPVTFTLVLSQNA